MYYLKDRIVRVENPDIIRATQALLSCICKFKVSLGTWQSGLDRETAKDILVCIPIESLSFLNYQGFLKELRNAWRKSGFEILEEVEVLGCMINYSTTCARIFRLSIA